MECCLLHCMWRDATSEAICDAALAGASGCVRFAAVSGRKRNVRRCHAAQVGKVLYAVRRCGNRRYLRLLPAASMLAS